MVTEYEDRLRAQMTRRFRQLIFFTLRETPPNPTSDSKLDELDFSDTDLSFVTKGKLSIRRANTEGLFDTSIFIWSNLVHSFGIMPFEISSHFVFEAAHTLRAKHKETFWTAQEYLIECFDMIDRRRTTKAWRADRDTMVRCLNENAGRGYYRYDDFLDGGDVFTDASKGSRGPAGGGYVLDSGCCLCKR